MAVSLQAEILEATPEAVERWLGDRPEVLERVLRTAPQELLQRALVRLGPEPPDPQRPEPQRPEPQRLPPEQSMARFSNAGSNGDGGGSGGSGAPSPEQGDNGDVVGAVPPQAQGAQGTVQSGRAKRNSVTSDLFQMWLGASPIKRAKSPSRSVTSNTLALPCVQTLLYFTRYLHTVKVANGRGMIGFSRVEKKTGIRLKNNERGAVRIKRTGSRLTKTERKRELRGMFDPGMKRSPGSPHPPHRSSRSPMDIVHRRSASHLAVHTCTHASGIHASAGGQRVCVRCSPWWAFLVHHAGWFCIAKQKGPARPLGSVGAACEQRTLMAAHADAGRHAAAATATTIVGVLICFIVLQIFKVTPRRLRHTETRPRVCVCVCALCVCPYRLPSCCGVKGQPSAL